MRIYKIILVLSAMALSACSKANNTDAARAVLPPAVHADKSTSVPVDSTPPAISAVTAAPGSTSATITWTTDKNSSSRVDYGTSPAALTASTFD